MISLKNPLKIMQNGPGGAGMPRAFNEMGNNQQQKRNDIDPRIMSFAYTLLAATIMFFIGKFLKLPELWVTKNVTQKNEFRFCCIAIFIVVTCAIYLYFKTKNVPSKQRVYRMKDDYPVAAYTMTVSALVFGIASFLVCVYLMGPFGIIFYCAMWVAFYNLLFLF